MLKQVLLWFGLLCAPLAGVAAEVRVAVAANFAAVVPELSAAFEKASGHNLSAAIGSTGRFYAQINNGAPFNVLLSADAATPQKLEAEGKTVQGSRFVYATGQLVLWSAKPGVVDAQGAVLQTLAKGQGAEKLALADPKLAPYGAAAMQVLTELKLVDALKPRLVQGDSVGQAHQFVASGNALLGFVALAQVWKDGALTSGSAWRVPAAMHAALVQEAVLLNPGSGNAAALAFMQFLKGPDAANIIRRAGYVR